MDTPLDVQLAYFYGLFVQAAYAIFRNPQNADPLRPEPICIPPGYELGAWIHMSDFILGGTETKFYGIVVHSLIDPDSRVIAIRGTEGTIEWIDDGDAIPVPFRQVPSAGRVACGFDRIYSSLKVVKRRIPGTTEDLKGSAPNTYSGSFADQLDQLACSREIASGHSLQSTENSSRPTRPTIVAAHSLGAALATLFVVENAAKAKFDVSTLCTFASPRVGNQEFVNLFDHLPIASWRIVNKRDIVPKLPPHIPIVLDFDHVRVGYEFDSATFAVNNLTCAHAMETYLHWLDSSKPLLPQCVPLTSTATAR